ncbi:TylF/MycF/NovP-related O-methyltransferase [Bacillus paranthracis]
MENPEIHPGWFFETLPHELPEKISFAYLDSDFYDPILISLEAIYPKLSKGAIVIIDDYGDKERAPKCWEGLPGVKKACDQFFKNVPESPTVLIGESDLSMCYFIKE